MKTKLTNGTAPEKLSPEHIKERNLKTYGEKIRKYRKQAGFSTEQLAQALHVSKGSVCNWECGISRPDPDYLYRMFSVLDVEPNAFFGFSGVGSILTHQEQNLIKNFRSLDPESREDLEAFTSLLSDKAYRRNLKKAYDRMNDVRMLGRLAAAGDGSDWEDYPEESSVILYDSLDVSKADEIFIVDGQSMEPMFESGDRVLVQYCNHIQNGEIGIYYVPGHGGVIKQAAYDRLHSINPKYDDIFPYEEGAKIIGKVLCKITNEMIPSIKEQSLYSEALEVFTNAV